MVMTYKARHEELNVLLETRIVIENDMRASGYMQCNDQLTTFTIPPKYILLLVEESKAQGKTCPENDVCNNIFECFIKYLKNPKDTLRHNKLYILIVMQIMMNCEIFKEFHSKNIQ